MMCSVDVPLFGFFPSYLSQPAKGQRSLTVWVFISSFLPQSKDRHFLKQDADYEGILAEFSIFIKLVQQTQ